MQPSVLARHFDVAVVLARHFDAAVSACTYFDAVVIARRFDPSVLAHHFDAPISQIYNVRLSIVNESSSAHSAWPTIVDPHIQPHQRSAHPTGDLGPPIRSTACG